MSSLNIVLPVVVIGIGAWFLLWNSRPPRTQSFRPSDLRPGPIRHGKLSETLLARIRKFEPIFAETYGRTHEEWVDGFQRDVDPEAEIAVWESIATAYQSFTEKRSLSLNAKKEAFGLLLVRSAGDEQHTLSGAKLRELSRADAEELVHLYSAAPKPILYETR